MQEVIQLEASEAANSTNDLERLAICMVNTARLLVYLYVPQSIMDPVVVSSCEHNFQLSLCHKRKMRLRAQGIVHTYIMGNSIDTPRHQGLRQQLAEAQAQLSKTALVNFARPKKSQIAEIEVELRYLLELVEDRGTLSHLIDLYQSSDSGFVSQCEAVLSSVSNLESRLSRFELYDDILHPALSASTMLHYGMALLSSLHREDSPTSTASKTHLETVLSLLNAVLDDGTEDQETDLISMLDSASKSSLLMLNMLLCQDDTAAKRRTLRKVLDRSFQSWFAKRTLDQKEAREKAGLYKSNVDTSEDDLDLEAIFPDYESTEEEPKSRPVHRDYDNLELFDLVNQVVQGGTSERSLAKITLQALSSLPDQQEPANWSGASTTEEKQHFALGTLAADSHARSYSEMPTTTKFKVYDFYKSPNPAQIGRLATLQARIMTRIDFIANVWSENALLLDLKESLGRLQQCSASAPLGEVLLKVEQLYALMAEWQDIASREFSINELLDDTRTLIVDWRRLELNFWPQLFRIQELNQQGQDADTWYNLYEVIIFVTQESSHIEEKHIREVTLLVVELLRQSTVGLFESRLSYVRTWTSYLSSMSHGRTDLEHFSQVLTNIADFFDQFSKPVSEHSSNSRNALEKEIKEVIKLASWKDVNVYALRESSKKSHRVLHKILQKYRRALRVPVLPMITVVPSLDKTSSNVMKITPWRRLANRPPSPGTEAGFEPDRPVRFQNIERTLSKMDSILTKVTSERGHGLRHFVDDLSTHISELRAETPSTFDAAKVGLIKHLKTRKRKLLSDSLRSLQAFGLKAKASVGILTKQMNMETLLYNSSALTLQADNHEHLFFKIASLLDHVRRVASSHTPELTAREVQKMVGLFDHLLAVTTRERSILAAFSQKVDSLQTIGKSFEQLPTLSSGLNFWLQDGAPVTTTSLEPLLRLSTILHRICDFTVSIHDAYRRMSETEGSPLTSDSWWSGLFQATLDIERSASVSKISVIASIDVQNSLQGLASHIRQFEAAIVEQQNRAPNEAYVFEYLRIWLAQHDSTTLELRPSNEDRPSLDAQQVEATCRSIADDMLLDIQTIDAIHVEGLKIDRPWLHEQNDQSLRLRQSTVSSISDAMTRLMATLCSSKLNSAEEEAHLRSVIAHYLPIFSTYMHFCASLREHFLQYHRSTMLSTFRLGITLHELASSGFCSPQQKESNTKDSEETVEGTGLADGQGLDDITSGLEDGEELGDLDQPDQAPPQDNPDDGEAREIEDDLAGEGIDQEEDQNASDDSENDDDAMSIEDEVGSVDEKNDNIIDEKMWDDPESDVDGQLEEPDSAPKDEQQQSGENDLVDKSDKEALPQDKDAPQAEDDPTTDQVQENDDNEQDQPEENGDEQEKTANTEILDKTNDELDEAAEESVKGEEDAAPDDTSEIDAQNMDLDAPSEDDAEMDLDEDQENVPEEEISEDGDAGAQDAFPTEEMTDDPPEPDRTQNTSDKSGNADSNQDEVEPANNDIADKFAGQNTSEELPEHEQEGDTTQNNEVNQVSKTRDQDDNAALDAQIKTLASDLSEYRRMLQIHEAETQEQAPKPAAGDEDMQDMQHVNDPNLDSTTNAMAPDTNDVDQQLEDQSGAQDILPRTDAIADGDSPDEDEASAAMLEDKEMTDLTSKNETVEQGTYKDDDIMHASPVDEELLEDFDTVVRLPKSWSDHQNRTRELSAMLCEQLRLILEPSLASRLKGDYKTGKRLNMRRIIPYIASQFKKDKIWLRRTKPSKRQYQVLLAIDDSRSMQESSSIDLALDSIALMASALSLLESGEISIVKFGETATTLHPFGTQFSSDAGSRVMESFTFDRTKTNVRKMVEHSMQAFQDAKERSNTNHELWQLQFIISDGICEDHDALRLLLRQALERRIMIVFCVLDTLASRNSILQMKRAEYVETEPGVKKLVIRSYMSDFAFDHYLIVQSVAELPELLSSCLRQFFAATSSYE